MVRSENAETRKLLPQKTLAGAVRCTGIGLHSGVKVSMTLKPAEPNTGITFVRTDLPGQPRIPARWDRVVDTRMCTVLGNAEGITIGTVEHLMAALAGLGIDNAEVEVDAPELPVMDGSSSPFVFLIECAGFVEQASPRRALRIREPVRVSGDGWMVSLAPAETFSLAVEIDYGSAAVAHQALELDIFDGVFKRDLARARTFGFLEDVERLRAAGLARGGSLDNAVVISGDRILNEDGLRYDDECVRHKALDALGDLYLVGAPIIGRFEGRCSGHAGNNLLLRTLFSRKEAWAWDVVRRGEPGRVMIERARRELRASAVAI